MAWHGRAWASPTYLPTFSPRPSSLVPRSESESMIPTVLHARSLLNSPAPGEVPPPAFVSHTPSPRSLKTENRAHILSSSNLSSSSLGFPFPCLLPLIWLYGGKEGSPTNSLILFCAVLFCSTPATRNAPFVVAKMSKKRGAGKRIAMNVRAHVKIQTSHCRHDLKCGKSEILPNLTSEAERRTPFPTKAVIITK